MEGLQLETLKAGFTELGVSREMMLEVHSSLSSLGPVAGGAETVIKALIDIVGAEGAIVMPSFLLSPPQPLSGRDIELGLTMKIRLLDPDSDERSGMGIIPDTFRKMPGVIIGDGTFRVSAWGKDAELHSQGFHRIIDSGYAFMIGVDIYRLSSMHYMEYLLPDEVKNIFTPPDEARKLYPEDKWFIEAGEPPVKAWYKIQDEAYRRGFIKDSMVGQAKCMFFKVGDVVGLYKKALETDPLGLYGITPNN